MNIKLLKDSFINISNNIYDSDFISMTKIKYDKISFE